ncbi:MAG: ribosome biogenesis GTPase Der [Phycisphaerales bacterium]
MPIPRIAIVGRPNVGKSSLLNMIAHEKVSIVDPTAGTTRDRVSVIADLVPPHEGADSKRKITVEVTDTGGFGAYFDDRQGTGRFDDVGNDLGRLTDDIEFQISEAVRGADLVLFVIDAQDGVTARDEQIATLLRERVLGGGRGTRARKAAGTPEEIASVDREEGGARVGRPGLRVAVVANKTDGPKWEAHAFEAAALGFGEPLCVSAKNNYFRRDFLDALYEKVRELPGVRVGPQPEDVRADMKLAIIGKRNAGKSSLVNALAGEKRVIVSEIAGTTRDAVDVKFEMDGKTFVAIDTAGLRKKKSFADRIEHFAFDRAKRAIDRADVVFMMIDATEPVSQVDHQLMWLVQRACKPCLIVVNKWDLVEGRNNQSGRPITTENYEEYLRKETKGLDFAPIAFVSADRGTNVRRTVRLAFELMRQAGERAGTGVLNRRMREILSTRGPSSKLGTLAKVYFVAQVATHPPTIVLVVNNDQLFTNNYQRFLLNALRKSLPYPEVPIRLIVKNRKRARMQDLATGEHQRRKLEAAGVSPDDARAWDGPAILDADLDDAAWEAHGASEFGEEMREAGESGRGGQGDQAPDDADWSGDVLLGDAEECFEDVEASEDDGPEARPTA